MLTNSDYLNTDEPSDNYCNTSTMLKNTSDTSNNKLIENNTLDDSSQLNQTQCKRILVLVNENAEINTQDEELVSKIVKKNLKHILLSNEEKIEINTQQFMDLNVSRIAQQLNEAVPSVSKIETHSNNPAISTPFITKKSKNPNQNNENDLTLNKPKELEKGNNEFCSGDLVSSNQDLDSDLLNQSQDPEIIIFRSMCDTMMNIIALNNDDNHSKNMINYQLNHNEQHLDISENTSIKKRQYDILVNDSSDNSSSQYCKKLSQNKKSKFTISTPFITKKSKNPNQNNENDLTLNKPKELEKGNNEFCSGDLVSSNQDLDSDLLNQSQDPEIIIFRSMCDTMMNIIAMNNDDNHSKNMINYQLNHNEQHLDISENTSIKKRQYDILVNDSSDNSSSQYCKKLSQNKKSTFTSQNKLNIQFKSHSKEIGQRNASKKNVIDKSKYNDDCIIVENTMKNHNQKMIINGNENILQQNNRLREIEPIFCCSPNGKIHKDMLNYINSNKTI